MAFEDVEETMDKYWNPEKIGENIEGNVYEIMKDQWGKQRIVMDMGDDAEGNLMTTILPPHAQLLRFIPNLKIGDYIRVELVKLVPPTDEQLAEDPDRKPAKIYKVQKDRERAQIYE